MIGLYGNALERVEQPARLPLLVMVFFVALSGGIVLWAGFGVDNVLQTGGRNASLGGAKATTDVAVPAAA